MTDVSAGMSAVVAGSLHEGAQFRGAIDDLDAEGCRFVDCRFRSLTVIGGRADRSAWRGGSFDGVRFTGVSMPRSTWLDLRIERSAFSGCQAYGAHWRRVRFEDCLLDSLNLRDATLRQVELIDCSVKHLDAGSARLADVTMRDCVIEQLDLTAATLSRVDLRGSRLDLVRGFDRLRGVTIDHSQLLELAPALATHLGLNVQAVD
jgi:uncharacterized protein YjbI with pentapeptide repeats